jgi:hypothetical protein
MWQKDHLCEVSGAVKFIKTKIEWQLLGDGGEGEGVGV